MKPLLAKSQLTLSIRFSVNTLVANLIALAMVFGVALASTPQAVATEPTGPTTSPEAQETSETDLNEDANTQSSDEAESAQAEPDPALDPTADGVEPDAPATQFQLNAQVWQPTLSVKLADGTVLQPGDKVYQGDQLTISGTGFDPLSHPLPAGGRPPITVGDPTGNYVVFGNFAEQWRPSQGVTNSATRVVATQRWAMTDATFNNINPMFVAGVSGQRVTLTAEGTFEFTIDAAAIPANKTAPAGGSYGVFTYVAGGGAPDAAQELELRLDYVDSPRPETPKLSVRLADGTVLQPGDKVYQGDQLTISGTGFDPLSHPLPAGGRPPITVGDPTGNYVVFGNFAEQWRPSEGVTDSATRVVATQRWAMTDATFNNINPMFVAGVSGQRVTLTAEGTFEFTIDAAAIPANKTAPAGGSYGVFTYVAGGGAPDAAQELELRLDYVDSPRPETPSTSNTTPTQTAPQLTTAPAQTAGSLSWGVKSSFVSYVTGLGDGSISSAGVGGFVGNWLFPQSASTWDADTSAGTISYSGSLTFQGHGMTLVTLTNPSIQISPGAQTATLSASGVPIATLNLAAAARTNLADGSVSWAGAPATLTSAGVPVFAGFYAAGQPLEPVSFTVGAINSTSFGWVLTRAAADQTPTDSQDEVVQQLLLSQRNLASGSETADAQPVNAGLFGQGGQLELLIWVLSIVLLTIAGATTRLLIRQSQAKKP